MKKLLQRLRAWYDKRLRPLPTPDQIFKDEIGKMLARQRTTCEQIKKADNELSRDVPKACRTLCVIAKAQEQRETEYVTGCEYQLPLRAQCRDCPHWSESRYFKEVGKLLDAGFAKGIEEGQKNGLRAQVLIFDDTKKEEKE